MVLKYVTKNGMRIHEPPYTQARRMSSTGASAVVRLLLPAQPMTVKRANETTMDLEQIIDDLVYRKKKLDLDSTERKLINRILTGLRYSYEDAGGIKHSSLRPLQKPAFAPARMPAYSRTHPKTCCAHFSRRNFFVFNVFLSILLHPRLKPSSTTRWSSLVSFGIFRADRKTISDCRPISSSTLRASANSGVSMQ